MNPEIKLRSLTTVQRSQAKERAVKMTLREIGDKPTFAQFENTTVGKYPPALVNRVTRLAYWFLVAAFIPSAIRLFAIGYETFNHNIESKLLAGLVATCIVALAEIGAILFTLAFAVLPVHRLTRVLLISAMLVSVAISLIGNYTFALYGQHVNAFAWLEALGPPSLTLITAYILKEVGLDAIRRRHADKVSFELALTDWQQQIETVESHRHYMHNLANALWDALVAKNRSLTDGLEFDAAEKSHYVRFELQQDNWYQDIAQPTPKHNGRTSTKLAPNDLALVQLSAQLAPHAQSNGQSYQLGASEMAQLFFEQNPNVLWAEDLSERQLAAQLGISNGTVGAVRRRLRAAQSNGHSITIED